MPKKNDGNHRGFAFVDFVSIEEAKKAYKTLGNFQLGPLRFKAIEDGI